MLQNKGVCSWSPRVLAILVSVFAIAAASAQPREGYPSAEQVRDRMHATARANPDLCVMVDLTERYGAPPTHAGRHLYAMKISVNPRVDEDEPSVLFVAAHHGDEIAGVLTALIGIDYLVDGYGRSPGVSRLLNTRSVWIAPLWNPDGYENGTRVNARNNDDGSVGVDLNRNYPFGFGLCGGSDKPGRITYQGPFAASEPETQTMLAFAEDQRFVIVHDAHAGAFELRTGYGCDREFPWREFMNTQAAQVLAMTGLELKSGSSCCLAGDIHLHMSSYLSHALLWELGAKSQDKMEASVRATKMWEAVVPNLAQPISLSGHTVDAESGDALTATLSLPNAGFTMGERGASGGPRGRFDLILPPGEHEIEFSAQGYESQTIRVEASPHSQVVRDIRLKRNIGDG